MDRMISHRPPTPSRPPWGLLATLALLGPHPLVAIAADEVRAGIAQAFAAQLGQANRILLVVLVSGSGAVKAYGLIQIRAQDPESGQGAGSSVTPPFCQVSWHW